MYPKKYDILYGSTTYFCKIHSSYAYRSEESGQKEVE
jgi:hypothetical protein